MSEVSIDNPKGCPLLAMREEHKAIAIGQGDCTVSYLMSCLEDKCIAYKNGYCNYFNNSVK